MSTKVDFAGLWLDRPARITMDNDKEQCIRSIDAVSA
jgi:hypothetical protein